MQAGAIANSPLKSRTDQSSENEFFTADAEKSRRASQGRNPSVLADIYQDDINIVIWRREVSATLEESLERFIAANHSFKTSFTVTPKCALAGIRKSLDGTGQAELSEDIAKLVDMFCCLFGIQRAGLRLAVLDKAMCPKFHVDKVPCRLVTTYHGSATEWLPHRDVDRSKLGSGSQDQSGLYRNEQSIQKLHRGDVALLKGELWEGNENAGLVHRSPELTGAERRLLLTIDFSN